MLQALRRAGYEPTAMRVDDSPLGRQRDFLRLVLDATPDLIFVKDSSGRFTMANRAVAELYGTTVDQLIGKCESDVNPRAEETLRSAAAEQDVIASGRPIFAATEPMTDPRTGSTRWFDIRRVPLVGPGRDGLPGAGDRGRDDRSAHRRVGAAREPTSSCDRRRRWKPSGSWPAASRTTSTTC